MGAWRQVRAKGWAGSRLTPQQEANNILPRHGADGRATLFDPHQRLTAQKGLPRLGHRGASGQKGHARSTGPGVTSEAKRTTLALATAPVKART